MSYRTIKCARSVSDQVFEIQLNAPPANILSAAMMTEISAALESAAADRNLKVIVISGAGEHFCYGASVEEHAPGTVADMLGVFHSLVEKILDHPLPTLAKVHGFCLGGGFELALACSLLIADQEAKFAVPEIQLGVFPPVAAALLPTTLASHLILSGVRLSAHQLQQAGLLTEIAENGALESTVEHYVENRLLPRSASSLRFAHRALRMVELTRFRSVIGDLESLYLRELMASHDAVEGIQSFLQKRPPEWKNC